MSDMLQVIVAGNLRHDVQIIQRRGQSLAICQICTARSIVVDGTMCDRTTILPIEVHGTGRAYEFQHTYQRGSRVLIQGHLDERTFSRQESLPVADGPGTVLVHVERRELVLVIDTVLDAGGVLVEHAGNAGDDMGTPAVPVPLPALPAMPARARPVPDGSAPQPDAAGDGSTAQPQHGWNWSFDP